MPDSRIWRIRNLGNHGVLDRSAADGSIISYTYLHGNKNQQWIITENTDSEGEWFIRSPVVAANVFLAAPDSAQPDDSPVILSNRVHSILITVHPAVPGCVVLKFASNPDYAFDLSASSGGASVVLNLFDPDEKNMMWVIDRTSQQPWGFSDDVPHDLVAGTRENDESDGGGQNYFLTSPCYSDK